MRRHIYPALLSGAALFGTCALAALPFSAQAADRALLIGVGRYADSHNNLPGIDLDIKQMRALAESLGFAEIATLTDQHATLDQVVAKIQTWLIQGTQASDRVLLYFSGHGSRIPDENGDETDDGADEVLTMYDLRQARRKGRNTLDGVLVDDQLGTLLAQIPSRKVLVLIDACHSGTADRSLRSAATRSLADQGGVSKSYWYPEMPAVLSTKGLAKGPAGSNYVMIAAARDDEASIATPAGSLFTRAIAKAFGTATPDRLTPRDLSRQATTGVGGKFHPLIQGNPALAAAPITLPAAGAPPLQVTDPLGTDLVVAYAFSERPAFLDQLVGRSKLATNESLYQQVVGAVAANPTGVAVATLALVTQERPAQ
ncbi:caspase family protein [uncultured Thiodictyon sp.]|uniref:caspase family protein n=1 Tax=uncultured Thiodictyon sp. TaxID=1846217 RepID=UPI0025EF43AD|nr:caspase family protein [uncultured Thiodictyon sp.]